MLHGCIKLVRYCIITYFYGRKYIFCLCILMCTIFNLFSATFLLILITSHHYILWSSARPIVFRKKKLCCVCVSVQLNKGHIRKLLEDDSEISEKQIIRVYWKVKIYFITEILSLLSREIYYL